MTTNVKDQTGVSEDVFSPNTPVQEIHRIFRLQQAYKQTLKHSTAKQRISKIRKLRETVLAYRTELHEAMYADFKKPKLEVDATEIYIASYECKKAINHLQDWMEPVHVDSPLTYIGSSSKIIHEPKGSSLIISPWNYPFNLTIAPLVSAIAAGNTAMIKPSEYTVHTSRLMKKMLGEIFEEQEVALLEGDHTIAQEMLKLKFDHIYFTGSPAVGKIIMKEASANLTSVTLELGGKSPSIIDEKVNLQDAVEKIIWGKFLNGGQTCIAPDYLFIHHRHFEDFKTAAIAQIEKSFGKDASSSPDYCRMVNGKHYERIRHLLDDAIDKGASVVYGGESQSGDNYIQPTILAAIPDDSEVAWKEIFGPILPVYVYSDLQEVIDHINAREKPLAMYIFSKDNNHVDRLMSHTSAGSTCINDTMIQFSHPNLLFGGVNHSGLGKGHGKWGYEEFTNKRSVLKQHLSSTPGKLLYPPYGSRAKKVIDLLIRWF